MKTIKRLLLGLTLGMLLVGCSTDPITTTNTPIINEPIVEEPTISRKYHLEWKSECNVTRLLIVNDVAQTYNLSSGNDMIYNKPFNQGDVIQLKMIRNGLCNSNTNIIEEQVAMYDVNNSIVVIKTCNTNCGVVLSEPFIIP